MSYEAWRTSFQSSEQAARAAFNEVAQLKAQFEQLRSAADPLVEHYFSWAEINEPDFTCDHNAELHSLYSALNDVLRQAAKGGE